MNIQLLSLKMNMQHVLLTDLRGFFNLNCYKKMRTSWICSAHVGHQRLTPNKLTFISCDKLSFTFKNQCHSQFTMQFSCLVLRARCVFGSPRVSSRRSFRRIYAAHQRQYELFVLTCVYFLFLICILVLIHRRY